MDEHVEKRTTRRFAGHAEIEISGHTRSALRSKGVLMNCSEGGVGFFSPEPMKTGEVILLRVCAESLHDTSHWPQEAGQFNMLTAKVRWCCEGISAAGRIGFWVGGQRMLPFY